MDHTDSGLCRCRLPGLSPAQSRRTCL